jgi:rhodanese-related sulfurtransferase
MQDFIVFLAQHWFLVTLWLGLLGLMIWNETRTEIGGVKKASPHQVIQLMNHEKASIFDLRDVDAFNQGHILGAKRVTLEDILMKEAKNKAKKVIVLVHQQDSLALKAATELKQKGYEKIHILKKSMTGWLDAGLPIVKVEKGNT